jgi:transposase
MPLLLSPDMRDWVPEDDMVPFVLEAVELVPAKIFKVNERGTGSEQYPPRMMLALLIYCYANGIFSSRRIERATYRDIAVRYLTGNTHPDHDTICSFRRKNFDAVSAAFLEVLKLAREMKILKVGNISVDGTHIKANAAKYKSIRYDRACDLETKLTQDIAELMEKAKQADSSSIEDGQRIPEEVSRREKLRDKMRQAKYALEERVRKRADNEQAEYVRKCKARDNRNGKGKGPKIKPPSDKPKEYEQINITDEDSRIMRKSRRNEYTQSYNAQAAVDADGTQLILHNHVTNCTSDSNELLPAVIGVIDNVGQPVTALADTGYVNRDHCEKIEELCVEPFVAPCRPGYREYDYRPPKDKGEKTIVDPYFQKMREKLSKEEGKRLYNLRKQTVEPAFGIIKEAMGFRQFLLRGLEKVSGEWDLVCLAYNVKRLFVLRCA